MLRHTLIVDSIIMLITFCFVVGDLSIILDYDYPVIQVVYNITRSEAAAIVMTCVLLILTYFASVTVVASSSRQVWAFARDGGFPCSKWIRKVSRKSLEPGPSTLTLVMHRCIRACISRSMQS